MKIEDMIVHDEDEVDPDNCNHVNTGRVRKWDGGNCPLLCARCRLIIGTWEPGEQS